MEPQILLVHHPAGTVIATPAWLADTCGRFSLRGPAAAAAEVCEGLCDPELLVACQKQHATSWGDGGLLAVLAAALSTTTDWSVLAVPSPAAAHPSPGSGTNHV